MSEVSLGVLYASLEMRIDRLERNMAKAEADLDKFGNRTKRKAEEISRSFRDVSGALEGPLLGMLALGTASVGTSARIDSLKRGLVSVTGSADAAEKEFARLQQTARLPGLGLEEAVRGSVRLQAVKVNADLSRRSIEQFGNALAIVGSGKAELDGIVTAITQIASKGHVFQEELSQISERLPQFNNILKEAFGTSSAEAIAKLNLGTEEFLSRIVEAMERTIPKAADSAQNAFENLTDSAKKGLTALGDIVLPGVATAAKNLGDRLDGVAKSIQDLPQWAKESLGESSALTLGLTGAVVLGGRLYDWFNKLKAIGRIPILIDIALVGISVEALMWLINWHKSRQAAQEDRDNAGRRWVASADTGLMSRVRGFKQFQIKPVYSKSLQDTLANINREQQNIATPTDRRMALNRDAEAMIEDAELSLWEKRRQQNQENDVPLGREGMYVRLKQSLERIQKRKKDLLESLSKARTNAASKKLGVELLKLRDEEKAAEQQLRPFEDPEGLKDEADRAARKAETEADAVQRAIDRWAAAHKRINERTTSVVNRLLEDRKRVNEGFKKDALDFFFALKGFNDLDAGSAFDGVGGAFGRMLEQKRAADEQARANRLAQEIEQERARLEDLKASQHYFLKKGREKSANEKFSGMFSGLSNTVTGMAESVQSTFDSVSRTIADKRRQKQLEDSFRSSFAGGFMQDLGFELGNELWQGLNKALGDNPFSRALSRSLTRLFDQSFDDLFSQLTKGIAGKGGKSFLGKDGGLLASVGGLLMGGLGGGLFGGLGKLLKFDDGGVIPGPRGLPRLILAHNGETVLPTHKTHQAASAPVRGGDVNIHSGAIVINAAPGMNAREVADLVVERIRHIRPSRPGG